MLARFVTDPKLDVQGIVKAWEDSYAVTAARWPLEAGGPKAVPHFDEARMLAFLTLPNRDVLVADDQTAGGPAVAAWMGLAYPNDPKDRLRVVVEPLAVTYANSPDETRARLFSALTEMLELTAKTYPSSTIEARYPVLPPDDQGHLSAVQLFTDSMTQKNGKPADVRGEFRYWSVTSLDVLKGIDRLSVIQKLLNFFTGR